MDDTHEDADAPMPLGKMIVAAAAVIVVLLGAGYGVLHVSSPAIRPGQKPPAGHYGPACGICHTVTPDAAVRAVS